jgi:hypothetical protein
MLEDRSLDWTPPCPALPIFSAFPEPRDVCPDLGQARQGVVRRNVVDAAQRRERRGGEGGKGGKGRRGGERGFRGRAEGLSGKGPRGHVISGGCPTASGRPVLPFEFINGLSAGDLHPFSIVAHCSSRSRTRPPRLRPNLLHDRGRTSIQDVLLAVETGRGAFSRQQSQPRYAEHPAIGQPPGISGRKVAWNPAPYSGYEDLAMPACIPPRRCTLDAEEEISLLPRRLIKSRL